MKTEVSPLNGATLETEAALFPGRFEWTLDLGRFQRFALSSLVGMDPKRMLRRALSIPGPTIFNSNFLDWNMFVLFYVGQCDVSFLISLSVQWSFGWNTNLFSYILVLSEPTFLSISLDDLILWSVDVIVLPKSQRIGKVNMKIVRRWGFLGIRRLWGEHDQTLGAAMHVASAAVWGGVTSWAAFQMSSWLGTNPISKNFLSQGENSKRLLETEISQKLLWLP